VADPAWLRRLLLRLAPHARVVRPADALKDFTTSVRDALRMYG
jgi:proteasome accessory factor C